MADERTSRDQSAHQGSSDYRKNGYGKLPNASAVQDFLKPAPSNTGSSTGKDSGSKPRGKR